ncbi:MAG: helix-turn-helix domain-containing protein [Bacteroidaceae bacterium]|nr:helix-turn-helix domain-containing protein [Bacteroidaceae bacterium]
MKERIYQIMQSQNMTQREFATALGISPSSLSSIFNGHTSPTNNTVQAIHRRFPEVSITWLMFGEGEMTASGTPEDSNGVKQQPAQDDGDRSTYDLAAVASKADADTLNPTQLSGDSPAQVIIRETVKYIDKPQRRITEIHVFYDDGTFETFSGRRD